MTRETQKMANIPKNFSMRPRSRLGWWIARWTILLVGVAFGLHFLWGSVEARELARTIEEFHRNGDPILPRDFTETPIPDSENAAVDLRAAAALLDRTDPRMGALLEVDFTVAPSAEDLAIIDKAAVAFSPSFAKVDEAATKAHVDWGLQLRTPVMLTQMSDLNGQRALAVLLSGDLRSAHKAGDDARAVRRARQILLVSGALDRQPFLVSHLVANGIADLGANVLNQIAPTLEIAAAPGKLAADTANRAADPREVRALIDVLLRQDADNAGLARAVRGERMMLLDTVVAVTDGHFRLQEVKVGGGGAAPSIPNAGYFYRPMLLLDARRMTEYMTKMAAATAAADLPSARRQIPAPPPGVFDQPLTHPLAGILFPDMQRAFAQQYRFRTELSLAATSLAIREYRLDHDGKFPGQLADLVPRYLPAVPLDPMTASKPLKYVSGIATPTHAGDPILYSVGEDGKDDGGSEEPLPSKDPSPGLWGMRDAVVYLTLKSSGSSGVDTAGTRPTTTPVFGPDE